MLKTHYILIIIIALAGIGYAQKSISQSHSAGDVHRQNASHTQPYDKISIPVRIVSSPNDEQAAESNTYTRKENERREKENLLAQRSIAQSSQIIAQYTPYQYNLGIISLVLSFTTVIASGFAAWFAYGAVTEAKKSTNIANKTIILNQETARHQLRAYLLLTSAIIPDNVPEGYFCIRVVIKNCGQTPAIINKSGHKAQLIQNLQPSDITDLKMKPCKITIGPGESITLFIGNLSKQIPELREGFASGRLNAYAQYQAIYTDIYNEEHTIKFVRTMEGNRELNSELAISFDHPDENT